jgi:BirA family biotin operon repressor/biotin-[acetyl-CoA-carboxylase] ligase
MNGHTFKEKMLVFSKIMNIDLIKKFIVFDEISSTNIKAKELAQDEAAEGTVVIAQMQKSGKGRFDRVWESPDGGLYLSIILKPDVSPDKATLLSLVAALAVSKTIRKYGISAAIKWPNDVRVNKKKIAGILLESEVIENHLCYVILGIGVNLNIDVNLFSKELKDAVTSLSHKLHSTVDYHKFLENLLLSLSEYYTMFINGEFDRIVSEWKILSDTIDQRVHIVTSSDEILGKAYDVDKSGFLLVITDTGEYRKIMSGDCLYFDEL